MKKIQPNWNGMTSISAHRTWPELTKRPDSTVKQTDQERYAALRTTSGGTRSGLKPSGFSDALCWTSQT